MISDAIKKIAVRSLAQDLFVDELPLNYYAGLTDAFGHRVNRKSFRIINREHLINSYPEE